MIPRSFRDATAPGPDAIARLERSFSGRSTHARLALLPQPGPAPTFAPRPRWRPWPALILAALLLAWLGTRKPPVLIDARLDAAETVTAAITSDLQIEYAGTGAVYGTELAPHIHWEVGLLRVAVRPELQLTVDTDEGTASGSGASFTVERDARGTTVKVERGSVGLSCADRPLTPGATQTCLPQRPAGLLARARLLRKDRDAALDAIQRGLALTRPGEPTRGELLALKVELLSADQPENARAAAQIYLNEGYQARVDLMRDFLRGAP